MYYSGRDGSLWVDGIRMGRVKDWALNATVEALETTDLGSEAKTYTPGLKSATGSCSILYHDDDPIPLLSKVINGGAPSDKDIVRLKLGWGEKKIEVDALIAQASLSSTVGAVMTVAISFSVTGDYKAVRL